MASGHVQLDMQAGYRLSTGLVRLLTCAPLPRVCACVLVGPLAKTPWNHFLGRGQLQKAEKPNFSKTNAHILEPATDGLRGLLLQADLATLTAAFGPL